MQYSQIRNIFLFRFAKKKNTKAKWIVWNLAYMLCWCSKRKHFSSLLIKVFIEIVFFQHFSFTTSHLLCLCCYGPNGSFTFRKVNIYIAMNTTEMDLFFPYFCNLYIFVCRALFSFSQHKIFSISDCLFMC